MVRFWLKCTGIVLVLFLGVLIGMQQANDGMKKMKGYEDPNFHQAVSLKETDNHINASILGNNISSHDIEAKKKKLEEISAYNLFSTMGKKMSEGISNAS